MFDKIVSEDEHVGLVLELGDLGQVVGIKLVAGVEVGDPFAASLPKCHVAGRAWSARGR